MVGLTWLDARLIALRSELRRPEQDRVIRMSLDVLLQVLRSLESLAAHLAGMGFERDMDADVRGDVIPGLALASCAVDSYGRAYLLTV